MVHSGISASPVRTAVQCVSGSLFSWSHYLPVSAYDSFMKGGLLYNYYSCCLHDSVNDD